MATSERQADREYSCPAGCPHCSGGLEEAQKCVDSGPKGGRLAIAAAGMFLLPLVLAMLAAYAVGNDRTAQLLAATGGLVLGVVIAATACRVLSRRGSTDSQQENKQP